jgi:hypothetical protein
MNVTYFRVLESLPRPRDGGPKLFAPDCVKARAYPNFIHQRDTQAWETTEVVVPNFGAYGTVKIDKVRVLVADSMSMYRISGDPSKVQVQAMCCNNIDVLYKLYFTAENSKGKCSGAVTIPLAVSDSRN